MTALAPDDNALFCAHLADELVAQGVRDVVVCPGSRSSPLAIALTARAELSPHIVVDERAAGFLALGLSKATKRCVPIVVTSGSAGAHLFPAIIECHEGNARGSGGALLALTADRPPELHGFGASQTIDQSRLFGAFAHFVDVGTPHAAVFRRLRHEVAHAIARGGVTQLNVPLREPLVHDGPVALPPTAPLTIARAVRVVDDAAADAVAAAVDAAACAAVVVGVVDDAAVARAAAGLAAAAGVPLIAELSSNARLRSNSVIAHADLLLRTPGLLPTPDVLVRFGGTPSTRALLAYVDSAAHSVVVGRVDPNRSGSVVVDADPAAFAAAVAARVTRRARESSARVFALDARARAAVAARFDTLAASSGSLASSSRPPAPLGETSSPPPSPLGSSPPPSPLGERERFLRPDGTEAAGSLPDELSVARLVVQSTRPGDALVLASSMPIRDAEAVGGVVDDGVDVFCNRGAAGIDGVISTAVGIARARAHVGGGRTTLLIGDLSTLHDLHGLVLAAQQGGAPLTIVVVNNDGGGIFSFLAARGHSRFEELWGTPHGLTFGDAARFARVRHEAPSTPRALAAALDAARTQGGPVVVEVRTDRAENVAAHQRHFAALLERIQSEAP
jgi:2-succinyl-5-enolpyruvyl-6-hydroxy-3-cyclohexene-1-carboxylate synthase